MKISDALRGVSFLTFDTAPLIYFVEKHPIYFERMNTILSYVADGTISGVTSGITLTEILTLPLRLNKLKLVNTYEEILLKSKGFQTTPISIKICRTAAELRARHNLKTPDALQIAAALEVQCDAFLTNDSGLKRLTEIRVLVLDELERD